MVEELFDVVSPEAGDEPGAGAGGSAASLPVIVLRLHVQPGAGRAAVVGRRGDALHVRVAPPPADGRANEAAIALVADLLDVPSAGVELVAGQRSRQKRVRVRGVDPEAVRLALAAAIDRAGDAAGAPSHGRKGRVGR